MFTLSELKVRLKGSTDSGTVVESPSTIEGFGQAAIAEPKLPFGSVHVENLYSVFQIDGVYGINAVQVRTTTSGTGQATSANNLLTCSTGATSGSYAAIQSRKRLRYRAGQGSLARFTAIFSSPVASSYLLAGIGSAESGFYFGYNGTSFGVLHVTGGVREIQTLTVTTASTSTQNYQVFINGTSHNVTATNNSSTIKTAYEISQGTYPGWTAAQVGSTVVFVSNDAGDKTGSFSIAQSGAGTPAAGSFVETKAGVSSTDTWVAQSSWNGDTLDGSGGSGNLSGFSLNPQKGNLFQIEMAYLGYGPIRMRVCTTSSTRTQASWVTVHTFKFPNTRTLTNVSQPSFPVTLTAYSAGSTTDISVSAASLAGFREGTSTMTGPRQTYWGTSTAVSTGSYYAIKTIRNDITFKGRANQSVVNLLSFGAAHDDATPVTFFLIKNATLVGTPNFTSHSTSSCTSVDSAATTCTISNNEQIIFTLPLGQSSNGLFAFSDEVTLQPGETLTIAAQTVTGTATFSIFSLNTREDQ